MTRKIRIGQASIGGGAPLMVIAGPCVLEDENTTFQTAREMKRICDALGLGFVFKSSYDKANRTSVKSYRGPGLKKGLQTFAEIKSSLGVPVISDVHSVGEVAAAAQILDALQIPAFLSRQTDLIVEAGRAGLPVNVKKGQFLSPWDVTNIVEKFRSTGSEDIILTERGTSFGYNNLVVDFRSFPVMRATGCPVVFDVTHSLQLPGGLGGASGGQREFAAPMMRAAAATGVDGLFFETHPDPDRALCDGPNMIPLGEVEEVLRKAADIHSIGVGRPI